MERIRNIFDRTRLCEGLRIPSSVAILSNNATNIGKKIETEIFKFLARSGVQTIFTSASCGKHDHNINPFLKEFSATASLDRSDFGLNISREKPEVVIWLDAFANNSCNNYQTYLRNGGSDYKTLNIYCSRNRYGFFYGIPTAPCDEIDRTFLGSRSFGSWSAEFESGVSFRDYHILQFALLAVYLTVSERIFDMATEHEGKAYLLDNGEHFDGII